MTESRRPSRPRPGTAPGGTRRASGAGRPGRSVRAEVLHLVLLPGDPSMEVPAVEPTAPAPTSSPSAARTPSRPPAAKPNGGERPIRTPRPERVARQERAERVVRPVARWEPEPTQAMDPPTGAFRRVARPGGRARILAAAPPPPPSGPTGTVDARARRDEPSRAFEVPVRHRAELDDDAVVPAVVTPGDRGRRERATDRPAETTRGRRKDRRAAKTPVDRRVRHRHLHNRQTVVGFLCAALLICGALFVISQPYRLWHQQKAEAASAQTKLDGIRAERSRIKDQLEVLGTDAEVERQARQYLNMVDPNQQPVTVLPAPIEPIGLPETWPFTDVERELASG